MNLKILIDGLNFAKKYELTPKEIEVLIYFLEQPYSNEGLAVVLKSPKPTLHHIIQKLKLKNLLVIKNKDKNRTIFYEFNSSLLEE
jgi:DNA-binding MarR family transcriptional regulator